MNSMHSNVEEINLLQRQFKEYVVEYDKRRGTNFLQTFPEYEQFFNGIIL